MSLDGITQPQYPLTVDGLSNINATTVYINGQQVVPDVGVYLPLAGGVMGGPIGMAGNVLTGLPTGPSGASDAVPLGYLTSQLTSYVPYSGATGPININGNRLSGLTGPIGTTDAVPLGYLTTQFGSYVPYSGATGPININGNLLTATGPTGGIITSNLTLPSLGGATGTYSKVLGVDGSGHVIPIVTPTGPTGATGAAGASGPTGPGANLLPLNNTWSGTNTFNNMVTTTQGYQTNLNNALTTSQATTGQGATNLTTSGLPSSVPSGSTLSGSYTLTNASSPIMAMSLGSYVYTTGGWYQANFFNCYSVSSIFFSVYQYNTAGTSSLLIGGGVYLPNSTGTTTTVNFQPNATVTYTGQVVFYFQGTASGQSVYFTGFNMYASYTQFTGNVLPAYRAGTPAYTMGIDSTGTMCMFPNVTVPITGAVSAGYLPYASSNNVLANSILYESAGNLTLNTNNGQPFTIVSSGSDSNIYYQATTGGRNYYVGAAGTGSGGGAGNFYIYDGSSGGGLRMVINPSGYMGIGTATPGCALDVVGQVRSNSVGNNATITFTSTYGAFGAIESYAYNNVYTKLPVNINAYGGSIGIGRNSTSVCTEEVQTNRVLCCNSFYITPAITGIFYPVVFSTVAAASSGQNPWKICIARTSVHQDALWKGALMSNFEGNSSYWGNGADYFKFQICGTAGGATFNYFIGNAYVDFTSGYLVVYLRGGTTYQYTCEGASLLYYPNGTVFSSYTIPAGYNTVLYSTSTPTTPFNTTYYTYDSVTGFSGFSTGVDGGAVAATYNNGLTVQGTAISSLGGYETVDLTSGFLYTSYQYVSAALQVYGNIWTWGTVVYSSDQRIKTNIQPSSSLLSKINQIQLHSYDFIDKTNNSNVSTVCGLVAQQLAPIFPEYIRTGEGFIPNIYQRAKSLSLVDGNVQVVFATTITGQVVAGDIVEYVIYQITVGVPPPTNTEKGSPTIGSSRETSTVISLSADGLTMVMTPWLRCDPTTQGIIVYGKQVPDFLQVDYSKMSCLGIKGVQELSSIVTSSASQIQELSAQLTITNNTITDQATQIGSLQTTITSQANQIATQATQITTLQSTIESLQTQLSTLANSFQAYITAVHGKGIGTSPDPLGKGTQ